MGSLCLTGRIGWSVALGAIALLAACGEPGTSSEEVNATQMEPQAVPVSTTLVRSGSVFEVVEATGTIRPEHQADIAAETQGQVLEIRRELGDWVENGDTILRLDPELYDLGVDQAEAQFLSAKATYEKAQRDFQRNEKLYQTRDISEFAFENSRLQMESAEAAFLTAKAALGTAKRQRRKADVTAPFAGWVAQRFVDLGQTVSPGMPLVRVVDISSVKVRVGLAEKDVVKVREGQTATLKVDAYPGATFSGEISAVGPEADPRDRSFPVEIRAPNSKSKPLRAGMIGKVAISTRRLEGVATVPRTALLERSGRTLLFVVKDGVANVREPVLGIVSGDTISISSGVSAGEEIVISGQENLADGTPVDVKNEDRVVTGTR